MPPSRSLLNQPINLETNNALYNHTVATGVIHGLPSGANVLGDKTASGRYISTATGTGPATQAAQLIANAPSTSPISYPVAYNSAPIVLVSGGVSASGCMSHVMVCSITTTNYLVATHGHLYLCDNAPYNILVIGS